MSEEENRIKQAIDNLKNFHIDKMRVFTANLDNDLEIVLNLIKNQQQEIEKYKENYDKSTKHFIDNHIPKKK